MARTFYSFNANTTSIHFDWPVEITPLERVALASQGDLQRILSAFFNKPIHVLPIYSRTSSPKGEPITSPDMAVLNSVSPAKPLTQNRQVQLQCHTKTVCTATSKVTINSSRAAQLFLVEKFAIGQMFKKLEIQPTFELLQVGFGSPNHSGPTPDNEKWGDRSSPPAYERSLDQLWRRYRLSVPEFDCEILEVFPTREMFSLGDEWLMDIKNGEPIPSKVFEAVQLRESPYQVVQRNKLYFILAGAAALFLFLQFLLLHTVLQRCKPYESQ